MPVQKSIQQSLPEGQVSFDKYLRYDEIQAYLRQLQTDYPNLVTVQDYGLSYENRKLTLIRISKCWRGYNPLIFIDAGIHAREWIAPAQALYIINQLVENPENQYLIEYVDWLIIPLLNPDGYEYSHLVDRFWRKTRSKRKSSYGVDPNRNFNYKWGGPGSSMDESSNLYAGPAPFSEPETFHLSRIITKYSGRIKLYLTFHAPDKSILYPWGNTYDVAANSVQLHSIATKVTKAISDVRGTQYRIGTCCGTRCTSGCSRDWVYGEQKVELAYTLELPAYGDTLYEMPSEMILTIVTEMFEGIKAFHNYIEVNFKRVCVVNCRNK